MDYNIIIPVSIISFAMGLDLIKLDVLKGLGFILLSTFLLILISNIVSSIGSPTKSSPTTAISISLSSEKLPLACICQSKKGPQF